MADMLLIDDELSWLKSLKRTLVSYSLSDFDKVMTAQNSREAYELLDKYKYDIILLDLILEGESGADILRVIKDRYPDTTVVIMTGVNSIRQAMGCIREGAADYLIKNMPIDELVSTLKRIIKVRDLERENRALKSGYFYNPENLDAFAEFVTASPKMVEVIKYLKAVSESSQPILIRGESGVGKGILAKAAAISSRPDKPFISLNAAGLDTQMFSDTLFGHVKGAYTGADMARPGLIKQAAGGTVFLDEIGDLPIQSQIKLLYLIQDGSYQQLGSDEHLHTKARFIFATNQNLEERLAVNEFRRDLFFRLNTHTVYIPPLRERPEDIPPLTSYFMDLAFAEYKKPPVKMPDYIMKLLQTYDFPGNARQLRSIIYDIAARSDGDILHIGDLKQIFENIDINELPHAGEGDNRVVFSYDSIPSADTIIMDLIEKALETSGGNQAKAAALIGISQPTISRRLKEKL